MTTTFTTWAALKRDALDALASYVADGSFITKEYTAPNGNRHVIRTFDEFKQFIEFCDVMAAQETAGDPATKVSYGRYRRF